MFDKFGASIMRATTLLATIAGLIICSIGSNTNAAIIMQDPFLVGGNAALGQYNAGNVLPGQNPTITNTSAGWGVTGSVSSAVNGFSTATGLTFGALPVSGGAIEVKRTDTGNNADALRFNRTAVNNATTTMTSSEEFYFSALISYSGSQRAGVGLKFENRNDFGIGFNGAGLAGIYLNNAFVAAGAVDNGGNPFGAGVYLVIGKVTPNNGATTDPETISLLYVNSDSSGIPGIEPAAVTTSAQDVWGNLATTDTLDSYHLYAQKRNGAGITGVFDEFKIGRTFASVVPEPASLALAGLGGLGLLVLARRQRA